MFYVEDRVARRRTLAPTTVIVVAFVCAVLFYPWGNPASVTPALYFYVLALALNESARAWVLRGAETVPALPWNLVMRRRLNALGAIAFLASLLAFFGSCAIGLSDATARVLAIVLVAIALALHIAAYVAPRETKEQA